MIIPDLLKVLLYRWNRPERKNLLLMVVGLGLEM